MVHIVRKFLKFLSPNLYQHCKELFLILSGRRLIEYYNNMNCDNIIINSDTKKFIDITAAAHSILLNVNRENNFNKIAFITCLPPEDTGVASCSLNTWIDYSGGNVDIFSPVINLDYMTYLYIKLSKKNNNCGPKIYDVNSFLSVDSIIQYKNIVIVIGNSNHHTYTFRLLEKIKFIESLDRVWLYLHDLGLLNILQNVMHKSDSEFCELVKQIYDKDININTKLSLHENLYKNKIYGPKLFYKIGIKNFLVNSQAAMDILQNDINTTKINIRKIFHPVFPLERNINKKENEINTITIGSFGIPGFDKKSDLIVDAVKYLKEKQYTIHLIIAGYSSTFFTFLRHIIDDNYVILIENPSESELLELMNSVDIAVQLRLNNFGESSGIVPQLLSLKKSIIVSNIGSFSEFGDAVSYVDINATKIDIANKIIELYNKKIDINLINNYINEHSSYKFREQFFNIIDL